jgi:hypothetical protein
MDVPAGGIWLVALLQLVVFALQETATFDKNFNPPFCCV